ncbi:uncharacterized protein LOC108675504 [Hyalella azteca]|uniref:Uncharacterized protein LOC108675504 n=1 Tax=Hyalella azteca TaxID=294128 RepID=A0A8B7NZ46_HYAAZ|nr:uncharacterized protein LOC108675504 [Hyalella azteca]
MRADMSNSVCVPGLPGGIANTPGGGMTPSLPHPQHPGKKRRQTLHRTRGLHHSQGGPVLHDSTQCMPLPPVSDPKTLQEKRELLEYFQKLRVLVPSLPKTGKIPKLEVIEHVITYIKQLENQLIDHPMIQVLENSAYISGLLQSMAPEFDISHLFPSRANSSQNFTGVPSGRETSSLQYELSPISQNPYTFSGEISAGASLSMPNSTSSAPTKLKARKSSVRKPLTLISATCSK